MNNFVAKHAHKFNRSSTFTDRKKDMEPDDSNDVLTVVEAKHIYKTFCPRNRVDLQKAVEHGMIPKEQLINNQEYLGYCRSYTKAVWDAANNVFVGEKRFMNDAFSEFAVHPQDDEGFDVFVPVALID